MLYNFFQTKQPQPGSPSLAFGRPSTLPVVEWDGPGIRVFWSFRPQQYPQAYQLDMAAKAGYGGLIASGIRFQPLVDTGSF